MPTCEFVKRKNVIVGLKARNKFGAFNIVLPTKYIGEGNHITANILQSLFMDAIAERTNTTDELAKAREENPLCGEGNWLIGMIYGPPPVESDY